MAFHIGLVSWETVVVIHKGANYGWPLREGTQARALDGMGPIRADDTIPIQISDTLTRGSVRPTYPILQYPHRPGDGDAIANGFIYRGKQVPALRDTLVFGDITTGRVWFADRMDLLARGRRQPGVGSADPPDGMIRKVVGANVTTAPPASTARPPDRTARSLP